MSTHLTYLELPEWLYRPLMGGAISQAEAAEIWDYWLLTPDGETRELPPNLHPAAQRLDLWATNAHPTVQ
jgi:hypothetical protein